MQITEKVMQFLQQVHKLFMSGLTYQDLPVEHQEKLGLFLKDFEGLEKQLEKIESLESRIEVLEKSLRNTAKTVNNKQKQKEV